MEKLEENGLYLLHQHEAGQGPLHICEDVNLALRNGENSRLISFHFQVSKEIQDVCVCVLHVCVHAHAYERG